MREDYIVFQTFGCEEVLCTMDIVFAHKNRFNWFVGSLLKIREFTMKPKQIFLLIHDH